MLYDNKSSHLLGSHHIFDLGFGFDLNLGIKTAGPPSHQTCYLFFLEKRPKRVKVTSIIQICFLI